MARARLRPRPQHPLPTRPPAPSSGLPCRAHPAARGSRTPGSSRGPRGCREGRHTGARPRGFLEEPLSSWLSGRVVHVISSEVATARSPVLQMEKGGGEQGHVSSLLVTFTTKPSHLLVFSAPRTVSQRSPDKGNSLSSVLTYPGRAGLSGAQRALCAVPGQLRLGLLVSSCPLVAVSRGTVRVPVGPPRRLNDQTELLSPALRTPGGGIHWTCNSLTSSHERSEKKGGVCERGYQSGANFDQVELLLKMGR